MPWEGKPKWSGEYAKFGDVVGKLFPVVMNEPFLIAIEGCNDLFFMLFSTEEKLKETVEKFLAKLGQPDLPYSTGRVLQTDMIDYLLELGRNSPVKTRLMCDPVVIDDHHTKWIEIVKEGDVYKYVDSELN